jgi:hypothetical protein
MMDVLVDLSFHVRAVVFAGRTTPRAEGAGQQLDVFFVIRPSSYGTWAANVRRMGMVWGWCGGCNEKRLEGEAA